MNQRVQYRGFIINSAPLKLLSGGFSSNGTIERHSENVVDDIRLQELQAQRFETMEQADNFYVNTARQLIDEGRI